MITCCDVVIVGGGAAGLSLGAALASHSRIVVLEREATCGYHATGRSAAIFVGSYGDSTVQELSALSRPWLESPPFENDTPVLKQRGLLHLVRSDAPDRPSNDKQMRLSVAEAQALVPILRDGAFRHAWFEDDAADIDVHALMLGWQRQIRNEKGKVIVSSGVQTITRAGRNWEIVADDRRFNAPIVVNAAGAWADDLARRAGAKPLGLSPRRRTAVTIPSPEGYDPRGWPMTVDTGETVYFKPESGGLLVSPADETPSDPHDAFTDELDVATGIARFEALTVVSVRRITAEWAGLRTVSSDRRPVLGFDPALEGFFWLAGQGGFGIQTAFGMAEIAASLISGADHAFGAITEAITPARFTRGP